MLSRPDKSSVVIIGCHAYDHLNDLPAVTRNLTGLAGALRQPAIWGVPRGRITVLRQPRTAEHVLETVEEAARTAEDTLVVYYAGHGLVDPLTGELHLALPGSRPGGARVSAALRFEDLRRVMVHHEVEANKRVLLLDCCFSGWALAGDMGTVAEDNPADLVEIEGTCVITASSETERALAPPGERFTAFTGALIRLLEQGVPGAGELLDMETLYRKVSSELRARSRPVPQQRNRNTGGRICIARNRATPVPDPPPPPSPVLATSGGTDLGSGRPAEPGPSGVRALWNRWWFRVAVLACVMAVLVGSATAVVRSLTEDGSCAEGTGELGPDNKGVGLTDGDYPFASGLKRVSERIKTENDRVADTGKHYETIVYMRPMTAEGPDHGARAAVQHELEGAYTAQYLANHRDGEQIPLIRLLLANTGSNAEALDSVVDETVARGDCERIVAVAGLRPTAAMERAVTRLTEAGVATVASTPATRQLRDEPGLVTIAPSPGDQAAAVAKTLSTKPYDAEKVLLVRDENPRYLLTRELAEEFKDALPTRHSPEMTFNSSQGSTAAYFQYQMPNLCLEKAGVVYFAGRGLDLPDFLTALADRSCVGKRMTVFSGDDVAQALLSERADDLKRALRRGNVELRYTGLAHADAWSERPGCFSAKATAPFRRGGVYEREFPGSSLGDGYAIMSHDMILTAVTAIRTGQAVSAASGRAAALSVIRTFYGVHAVAGASGWISMSRDGTPDRKAIPIIEVEADGDTRVATVLSRTGIPYEPPGMERAFVPHPMR
ncbi:caspase family protein [Streptomyces pathocidini]|uniref:Caspase family protein n=1 Tax=Streptomyces pathocidini TaxID=1650571 RepID=A0ABW7UKJ1_9ACTN|nr:caspase family protein [Streptomyces pathocidini]